MHWFRTAQGIVLRQAARNEPNAVGPIQVMASGHREGGASLATWLFRDLKWELVPPHRVVFVHDSGLFEAEDLEQVASRSDERRSRVGGSDRELFIVGGNKTLI